MPVQAAKITRPRLSAFCPRERLFQSLDQAARQPVIWVAAPPGAGKTTLVAGWLAERKLPSLWYRLDPGDGDLATFFYYLGQAAKQAAPRHRKALPLFTPEYQFGLSVFSRRFFESLFSRLKSPAVVVFDDCHEIPAASPLHGALRDGLEAVPEGVTVVFISREAPTPSMSRLKAGGRMAMLGWDDIRLTFDETVGIADLYGKSRQPLSTLRHFHDTADGWAAGVVLMMAGANRRTDGFSPAPDTPYQEVFDYFAGELLEKMESDMQTFLLSTAFLHSMTVAMAEGLSGIAASGKILSYLCRNHYFTEVHVRDNPVYRYHPLFRKFLLSRAQESLRPEELTRLQRCAARLLAEEGEVEDAAALFRQAGDWEGLVALILNVAPTLMAQGRHQTLQEWIGAVPQEIVDGSPWLLYWSGACLLSTDPGSARQCLEKALARFDADACSAGVFTAWALAVDSFMLDPSGVAQMDHWIALIDELRGRYPVFPTPVIAAQVAIGILFSLAIRQPHRREKGEWAARALALSLEARDPHLYAKAAQSVILHHIWLGELPAARLLIESLREQGGRNSSPPINFIFLKFVEAAYCWISAQPDASLAHVSEGLAVSQTTGVHLLDYLLLGQGTSAALSNGEMGTAAKLLEKMGPVRGSARLNDISYYHHLVSWQSLLRGDTCAARAEAEEALRLAVESGPPFAEAVSFLMLARVLHMCGEPHRAEEYLARAHRLGNSMKSSLIEFPAHLLDAHFAFDKGEESVGLAGLRTAMAIGRDKGLMNYNGWHPPVMARLCAKALECGIETEYVREMICRRRLSPPTDGIAPEKWPWSLRIYTLGRFELVKEGDPVAFSGKVQKKPLEFLKALVALGGKDVREEQISDLLWPDCDGDQAHKSFEVNLLRLRRLLGHDTFVHLREGCVTLNGKCCYVDVWALSELIGHVAALLRKDPPPVSEAERLMRRIFGLYRGHFLAGETGYAWALPACERVRSKFLRFIEKMGRFWQERGEPELAVDCYLKGLDADDLAEEFYQGLIVNYGKLDRPVSARDAYNRCRTVLAVKHGIKPSPKTDAIYHALCKDL